MNILDLESKRTSTLLVAFLAVFCFLGGGQVEAAKMPKIEICHFDGDEGVFKKISVSGKAVQKHVENHGDIYPGKGNDDGSIALDAECLEVTTHPAVLARAYIDRNRNGIYDSLDDVEIAELLDTNLDGVPSVGDSVSLGQYPKSFDPCPDPNDTCQDLGNFNAPFLVVGQVNQSDSQTVFIKTGGTFFRWIRGANEDSFGFAPDGFPSSFINDNSQSVDVINITSVGEPMASDSVSMTEPDAQGVDDYFVNVEVFVTAP